MLVFWFFVLCLWSDQSRFSAVFFNCRVFQALFFESYCCFYVSITVFLLQPVDLISSQVLM